jgi:hypothetical protein
MNGRKATTLTLLIAGFFLFSVPFAAADSSRPGKDSAPWAPPQTDSYSTPTDQLGDLGDPVNPNPPMNFSSNRPSTLQAGLPQNETPLAPVPEPESIILLASGLMGLSSLRRLKRS